MEIDINLYPSRSSERSATFGYSRKDGVLLCNSCVAGLCSILDYYSDGVIDRLPGKEVDKNLVEPEGTQETAEKRRSGRVIRVPVAVMFAITRAASLLYVSLPCVCIIPTARERTGTAIKYR